MAKRTSPPPADTTRDALKAIYEDLPTEPHTDLTKLQSTKPARPRNKALMLMLGFFVLAAIIALAGFLFFSPKKQFSNKTVTLSIQAPETAASGDVTTWVLIVHNGGTTGLKKAELNVQFPDGFQFVTAQPAPSTEFNNGWSFGAIGAGSEKKVVVSGKLIGEVGDKKTMSASASYQPANFASTFLATASKDIMLATSTLDVSITAPTTAANNDSITYTVTATNTSTAPIERVRLELDYPSGLHDITTDPKPTQNNIWWEKATLEAAGVFTVTVKGTLTGSAQSVSELKARVGIVDEARTFHVQKEQSALVLVSAPTLNVSVTANGSASAIAVNTGDSVKAKISYANTGESVFSDVTLTVSYAGQDASGAPQAVVEADGITSKTAFTQSSSKQEISWTKKSIPAFARLTPGTKGDISVTLPLKKSLHSIGTGKNFTVSIVATLHSTRVDENVSTYEKHTDPLAVKINSTLRVAAEARYYSDEGVAIGLGPLPPQSGGTTQYQISWLITNTLNSTKDVLLSATLPNNVTFVDAQTTGGNNLTYDATTKKVRWQINNIDAGVGATLPTLQGTFHVSITPVDADVGKTLALLGTTSLAGTDAFTGNAIAMTAPALTTDLTFDPQASGKGVVVGSVSATNPNPSQ